jgi:ACS family pantothenate transporter-like MFS transporter
MSTGFLASGVVKHLDGVNGLEGWHWLSIVCAIITFPVAIYGFIFFSSTPDKTKSWFLTDAEKELARQRMKQIGGNRYGVQWVEDDRQVSGALAFLGFGCFPVAVGRSSQASSNNAHTLWIKSLKSTTSPKSICFPR